MRTTPWQLITRFLILAKLAPSTADEQGHRDCWSNILWREHRADGAEQLTSSQADQLRLFEQVKNQIWSSA